MIEAANWGGLAYVSEGDYPADIAAGRLLSVLDGWTPPFTRTSLYYPGRRHAPLADLVVGRLFWTWIFGGISAAA